MNSFAYIALFGWPAVVLLLFATIKPRRAVLVAFLFGWLFLPMAGIPFQGLPDYTKTTATVYSVLLGIVLFDAKRFNGFRFGWIDVPMVLWCLVPMASSLSNGLGAYDGASALLTQTITWGMPYFIGRLYFSDLAGMRELAIGVFLGGLIYVPLCLYEVRMAPVLHYELYGYYQHRFAQHIRFGGYRPMVFMQHGLAVALWMTSATLVGIGLWRTGALRRVWNVPMPVLLALMIVTTVFCRSVGALALLATGALAIIAAKQLRMPAVILVLALVPPLYIGTRLTGVWDGQLLVTAAEMLVSDEDRTRSLAGRLEQEDVLGTYALEQPVFGWGGWGRNRPAFMGRNVEDTATDGFWVIALGQHGLIGVLSIFGAMLVPVFVLWRKLPTNGWWHPLTAPAGVMAVFVILFAIDSLLNAMMNPIFILTAGGLAGFARQSNQAIRQITAVTDRPTPVRYRLSPARPATSH